MENTSIEAVKKSVRTYVLVFVSLMALTVVTVAVSSLHLSVGAGITVALVIASFKATLVAGYFMHLISEQKLIYSTLILTAIVFVVLMLVPISHLLDGLS